MEYLLQWKGHPDDVSWEGEENLTHCDDLIKEYNDKLNYEINNDEIKVKKKKEKQNMKTNKQLTETADKIKINEIPSHDPNARRGERIRKKKKFFDN